MNRSAYVLGALSFALLIPQNSRIARNRPLPIRPISRPRPLLAWRRGAEAEDFDGGAEMPSRLRRQIVSYPTREAAGTIIVDTPNTYLYYVLGDGRAVRYGIGVGRDGFRWSGTQRVARKAEWPDWNPPAEMIARQPYLPRFMAGGPSNPMGARALYLGNSIYRIHGTNAPSTIGGRVSSGCIRMLNDDVVDLYGRVKVGSKVVVYPDGGRRLQDIARPVERRAPQQVKVKVRAPEPVATRAPEAAPMPQAARETEQLSATRRTTAATQTIYF